MCARVVESTLIAVTGSGRYDLLLPALVQNEAREHEIGSDESFVFQKSVSTCPRIDDRHDRFQAPSCPEHVYTLTQ